MGYMNAIPTGANIELVIGELTAQRGYPIIGRHESVWPRYRELESGANGIADGHLHSSISTR